MSFLDNLENNLKNMESREERGTNVNREQQKRESQKAQSRAIAPYAEQLRKSSFTTELLNEAARIGYGFRTKVYMTWIDNTLRLDAREHRLELKPTPDGVKAQFFVNNEPKKSESVDLAGANAKALAERWMKSVGPRPQAAPTAEGS